VRGRQPFEHPAAGLFERRPRREEFGGARLLRSLYAARPISRRSDRMSVFPIRRRGRRFDLRERGGDFRERLGDARGEAVDLFARAEVDVAEEFGREQVAQVAGAEALDELAVVGGREEGAPADDGEVRIATRPDGHREAV
jgi:hypothetical protein